MSAARGSRAIGAKSQRSLSLRQTCRQLGQSTFDVLVDAVTSLFSER